MKSIVVGSIFIVFPINSFAASFDCSLASSKVEKQICNNQEISSLDSKLGEVYKVAGNDPDVRKSQRDWIRNVRNAATNDEIMIVVYKQRILELESKVSKIEKKSEDSRAATPENTLTKAKSSKVEEQKPTQDNNDKIQKIYRDYATHLGSISLCEKSNYVFGAEHLKEKLMTEAKEDLGAAYNSETMRSYYQLTIRNLSKIKSLRGESAFIKHCQPYMNLVNEMNAEQGEDIDF